MSDRTTLSKDTAKHLQTKRIRVIYRVLVYRGLLEGVYWDEKLAQPLHYFDQSPFAHIIPMLHM